MKVVNISYNKAYVGVSARDNQEIVERFQDEISDAYVWFHIDDASGPHVVVHHPSEQNMKEAALLAVAKVSKVKEKKVRPVVSYCNINELIKTRKMAVGEFEVPDHARKLLVKI